MIPTISLVICHQSYYDIIDYIANAAHYIRITYVFYNWKVTPTGNQLSVLCIYETPYFVLFVVFVFILYIPCLSEIIQNLSLSEIFYLA